MDLNTANFNSFCGLDTNELWSVSEIQAEVFSYPPHETLAIDLTAS